MSSWQATFTLKKNDWNAVDAALSDAFEALVVKPVIDGDPNSDEAVMLIFPEQPDRTELEAHLGAIFDACGTEMPSIEITAMPDIDWLQHVYETLTPIEAGRFFVHGAHVKDIPGDKVAIVIEAAAAFGTGEHPTTKGCLTMLDRYLQAEKPKRILDMGCGSGILAIGAAKVLQSTDVILGVDIDPASVRVAQAHADSNNMENRIQFIHGDGFHDPSVAANGPYDLTFGNILAQPLIEFADLFCLHTKSDMILSGFTDAQRAYVEKPYLVQGCKVKDAINIDGWMTLWLTKQD
jgi:ribosomal protein L11 methyltransferase